MIIFITKLQDISYCILVFNPTYKVSISSTTLISFHCPKPHKISYENNIYNLLSFNLFCSYMIISHINIVIILYKKSYK